MKCTSIQVEIEDDLYTELKQLSQEFSLQETVYIREAILHFNRFNKRKLQIDRIRKNKLSGDGTSSETLSQFEKLQDSHFIL